MPELPEVETMVRGIRPFVEGREIAAVCKCRRRYRPIQLKPGIAQIGRRTRGETVTCVRRVAKRVVLELSSGDRFVIEPRMTGLMLLADPPDRSHLRLQWRLNGAGDPGALWFWDRRGLGTVRLYRESEFLGELMSGKLGPDALTMTEDEWSARCARTTRAIKVALLDQKFVAGIGNLYASEILHRSRIHPSRPADRLTRQQVRRLRRSVGEVLNEAIRYEGSTLGDGTYRNALNKSGQYQNAHRVYNREGQLCPVCRKAPVERYVQAQRSTFFCPHCQGRLL